MQRFTETQAPALTLFFLAVSGAAAEPLPASLLRIEEASLSAGALGAPPGAAELEARGARIGRIEVRVDDVFEPEHSLAAPYRLANRLHRETRAQTVVRQLLFHEGDRFNGRVLAEAERLLRSQPYFSDAWIEPLAYHDDNTVDVLVRVHDVWTISPGISFGREGGRNSVNVEFEDKNFLGLGKQIAVERSSNADRSAYRFSYDDPQLLGGWWALSTDYASMSDGYERGVSIGRPFYSLDSRWSVGVAAWDAQYTQSQYALGRIVDRFQKSDRSFALEGGWSPGLIEGWTTRYLAGLRYELREFAELDASMAPAPENRTLAYPWIGVEWIEDQYGRTRNLEQIGRTEDLHLGRSARLQIGYAAAALGSTRSAVVLNGRASGAAQPGAQQYLLGSIGFKGRLEANDLVGGELDLTTQYFLRQSEHRVLFAGAQLTWTHRRDPETQLLLGGDTGLRGYPLRFQAGDGRALLTIEERFYTNWQPMRLFNVGAAVFADVGRTWGDDAYGASSAGWLRDVGVGLRIGSARSAAGAIIHIDLAAPLDGGDDIDDVQLLIETKRSF
jgi:hypothetical protein